MKSRRILASLLCLAPLVGCGKTADDRLAIGTSVIAYDPSELRVLVAKPDPSRSIQVPVGTKLQVTSDESEQSHDMRPVQVKILEGESKDEAGYVCRKRLRPAP